MEVTRLHQQMLCRQAAQRLQQPQQFERRSMQAVHTALARASMAAGTPLADVVVESAAAGAQVVTMKSRHQVVPQGQHDIDHSRRSEALRNPETYRSQIASRRGPYPMQEMTHLNAQPTVWPGRARQVQDS